MPVIRSDSSPEDTEVTQSSLPDSWSCETDGKGVRVEVKLGDNWIEIPTTEVETWVAKGQAAAVQRSAKIRFPTEWDGEPVRDLLETFQPDSDENGLMQARIQYQQENGTWVYVHNGWVNGLGQSSDVGISKFWVRDFAELLGGVPVTGTFNHPSVAEALEKINRLTGTRSTVPVTDDPLLIPPEAEEEFAQLVDGDFENVHYFFRNSETPYVVNHQDFLDLGIGTTAVEDTGEEGVLGGPLLRAPEDQQPIPASQRGGDFGATIIETGQNIPVAGLDTRAFRRNHDTLRDLYSWFEKKTQCKLHFEPTSDGEGVRLVADVVPDRRRFVQREVIDDGQGPDTMHQPVDVIDNEALLEIQPINTLHLRGQVGGGLLDDAQDLIGDVLSNLTGSTPPSDKFPVVKVQDPALVDAAGGAELAPETVESDATDLDTAEQEAKKRLAEELEGFSQGEVMLFGTPMMMPFDRLDAFETCGRFVEFQQPAITYEIEEVKHVKKADDVYRTRVLVSVWANEQTIETVDGTPKMVPVQGRSAVASEDDDDDGLFVFGLPVGGWF